MNNPFNLTEEQLPEKAKELRIDLLTMLGKAPSGHTAGPLGTADIFACIYFNLLGYDPKNPTNDERDRFFLSCGHYCPILYTTMANAGYFPKEELSTLRKIDSRLQGHPSNIDLPGIENSSGPLGQGISQAVGAALRAKIDHKEYRIFTMVSDGENQEGQVWEALMFASAHHLDNLYIITDFNNIEIDGYVGDILPLEPLMQKYQSFNLNTFSMNGNNVHEIMDTMHQAIDTDKHGCPTIIIAKTIPGFGVPFMENKFEWHGIVPNQQQAAEAISYLNGTHA